MAHTYRWEGGGAAVLGSIQPQPIAHQADGSLALADIEASIKPDDAHFARTRLLCLENTFRGQPLTMSYMRDATELARQHGGLDQAEPNSTMVLWHEQSGPAELAHLAPQVRVEVPSGLRCAPGPIERRLLGHDLSYRLGEQLLVRVEDHRVAPCVLIVAGADPGPARRSGCA
jgi:hypothetical protein